MYGRGRDGEEAQDYGFKFANQRRRSNSSNKALNDFKTKFEEHEQEHYFDESLHGPLEEADDETALEKEDSLDSSSTMNGSIDGENELKK